ncbi:MAG TPA: TPM domain-containing protein [Bacteroidia bacterium]|nr:TPM domain-containing protein [Bacteroidia bacterium]
MASAKDFFSEVQVKDIGEAIGLAEAKTSGEIRIHIEKKCSGDAIKAAENWFGKLGMHKTDLRNGVLVYLAVESRVFAIYGDKGINEKVPPGFWFEISGRMEANFKEGKFSEGLIEAITKAGEQLQQFFPRNSEDKDELTNDISFQ